MSGLEDFPELKEYVEEKKQIINQGINHFCQVIDNPEFWKRRDRYGNSHMQTVRSSIVEPVKYAMIELGGKRVRPLLVHIAHDLVRGEKASYPYVGDLATISELVHKGTLLNDDIADNSLERNGVPATHIIFGENTAANVGDWLYFAGQYYLMDPDLFLSNGNGNRKIGADKRLAITEALNEELAKAHEGQGADLEWGFNQGKVPSESQFYEMAIGKSTYPLSLRLGAILGGADEKLYRYGGPFGEIGARAGLAFQLRDDVLELNPKSTDFGEDIREKKLTLPVIKVLGGEYGPDAARELEKLYNSKKIERTKKWRKSALRVAELLKQTGSIDYTMNQAHRFAQHANITLEDTFPEDSESKKIMNQLIQYGVSRTH